MLRIEVIIGLIASAIAILTFMARAYANMRAGKRIKNYNDQLMKESEAELRRLQEELQASREKKPREE